MQTADELEPIIQSAINVAVSRGYAIVAGDWGVRWNNPNERWEWDPTQASVPCCCAMGAVLLALETEAPHRTSDEYKDVAHLLSVDHFWIRDFMNGFEGHSYQGEFSDAFVLGQKLGKAYRPKWLDAPAQRTHEYPSDAHAES